MEHADVLVIGGGVPGLAAALDLARAGVRVRLIEARGGVGEGASGRTHGLAYAGLTEHPWRLVASLGAAEAGALLGFADRGLRELEALGVLERTGVVWAAVEPEREPAELEQSAEALGALGREAVLLSAREVATRTGASGLGPGLLTPDEGMVEPARLVGVLREAAKAAGVGLSTHTPADAVGPRGEVLEVRAGTTTFGADAVVLAAEDGLRKLHPIFADTLTPVREQAVLLDAPVRLKCPLRAGFGWTVARPSVEGTVVSGARFASPTLEEGERDDTTVSAAVQARLDGFGERFLPGTGPARRRWSWITAHGCDGLPLVGPLPTDPRIVVLAGFAGHESTLGLAAGRAAARGLLDGTTQGVPRCLSTFRFL